MDRLCYNDILYYRLQMSCPVCLKDNRTTPIALWTHDEDDGSIYIGSDGFLLCVKCRRRAHIRYWKFQCPYHHFDFFGKKRYGKKFDLFEKYFIWFSYHITIFWQKIHRGNIQQYRVSLKDGRYVNSEIILNTMGLSLPLVRQLSKTWLSNFIQNI